MQKSLEQMLEIKSHEEKGFAPQVRFGAWRVAMSNAVEDEQVCTLQRHLETDESFVMLAGAGDMLVASGEDRPQAFYRVPMESKKIYNVRQGTWHAHQMRAGSTLLIVENDGTGNANSDTHILSEEERQVLREI